MELGNALFGHSRSKYPLNRGKGFEEVLDRLLEVCAPNNRMYGEVFENERERSLEDGYIDLQNDLSQSGDGHEGMGAD